MNVNYNGNFSLCGEPTMHKATVDFVVSPFENVS
jgi:hypothetical protein